MNRFAVALLTTAIIIATVSCTSQEPTVTPTAAPPGTFSAPTLTPSATPTTIPTPTATPRPTPTPTPTPIPLPKAAFAAEGRAGQAPLTVSFLNQSQHATEYSWDFGDGGTSTEAQPKHIYTKTGNFTVSLVARSLVGPTILTDTAVIRNVIQVLPGPLSTLSVLPQTLSLEPKQTAQVAVTAQDALGNNIPNASQTWAVASGAGNIDPSGLFQAGTKAASYPKALTLQASYSGVTKTAAVDVYVVPGPLASATLLSSNDAIYTGDTATLHLTGFDAFGNSVTLSTAQWESTAGLTTGNTSQGVLKTTRTPGPISVAVQASDGRKTATANASVSVRQGFCETRTNQTQWSAVWRTYNADGSNGPIVGQQTLPSQFDQDWGSGPIVSGLSTNLLMVATSAVVVQRSGIVLFTVGADDGYRLKIAGQEVLTNWNDHSYTTSTYATNMVPGVYQLELDYYQDLNKARLSFSVDADVTSWTEATTCHGAYAEPPDTQYFVYQGGAEQVSNVLNRFNIPVSGQVKPAREGRVKTSHLR